MSAQLHSVYGKVPEQPKQFLKRKFRIEDRVQKILILSINEDSLRKKKKRCENSRQYCLGKRKTETLIKQNAEYRNKLTYLNILIFSNKARVIKQGKERSFEQRAFQ